jgi:hypothetical protein
LIRLSLVAFTVFGVLHLAGFREHMAFVSGTAPASGTSLVSGLVYAGAWFFAVLVAPVFLLSGLVLRAGAKLSRG